MVIKSTKHYAEIRDWEWWDNGNAQKVHRWLEENTELGMRGCLGQRIYFQHEKELIWFKLKWAAASAGNATDFSQAFQSCKSLTSFPR